MNKNMNKIIYMAGIVFLCWGFFLNTPSLVNAFMPCYGPKCNSFGSFYFVAEDSKLSDEELLRRGMSGIFLPSGPTPGTSADVALIITSAPASLSEPQITVYARPEGTSQDEEILSRYPLLITDQPQIIRSLSINNIPSRGGLMEFKLIFSDALNEDEPSVTETGSQRFDGGRPGWLNAGFNFPLLSSRPFIKPVTGKITISCPRTTNSSGWPNPTITRLHFADIEAKDNYLPNASGIEKLEITSSLFTIQGFDLGPQVIDFKGTGTASLQIMPEMLQSVLPPFYYYGDKYIEKMLKTISIPFSLRVRDRVGHWSALKILTLSGKTIGDSGCIPPKKLRLLEFADPGNNNGNTGAGGTGGSGGSTGGTGTTSGGGNQTGGNSGSGTTTPGGGTTGSGGTSLGGANGSQQCPEGQVYICGWASCGCASIRSGGSLPGSGSGNIGGKSGAPSSYGSGNTSASGGLGASLFRLIFGR